MKRLISVSLSLLVIFSMVLAACGDDKEDLSNVEYGARTANFYANMDKTSFWFKMTLTQNGETCLFTQATNGTAVTTVRDYDSDNLDSYEIFVGNAIHDIDINAESYDTIITNEGQAFLFTGYNQSMFTSPYSYGVSSFEGESYYCEAFTTSSGDVAATDKYYFDYDRLVAVEMIENGVTVMTMRFEDYSNTIPSDIYLSAPQNFKAHELIYEHSGIDYSDIWGDISLD